MTHRSDRLSSPNELGQTDPEEIKVSLPCSPDHFAEFITGLLGRPQTIRRKFHMLFDIDRNDLISLHHLVVRRVEQQNDAHLIQFVASITFHDRSSVRITSFTDFEDYNEVRPLRSVAVLLNWVFLIHFRDRRYPEKQEITVHFMAPDDRKEKRVPFLFDEDDTPFYYYDTFGMRRVPGIVQVEIKYTARTWGNDVDSLLKGQIGNLEKMDNTTLKFIHFQSTKISLCVAFLIFVLGIMAMLIYKDRLDTIIEAEVQELIDSPLQFEEKTTEALRALLRRELLPGRKISAMSVFGVGVGISIALAITLGMLTERTAVRLARVSRVKLTRLSERRAIDDQVVFNRRIAAFAGTQILNVAVGLLMILLGNVISEHLVL